MVNDMLDRIVIVGLKGVVILFVILAFICACDAYGDTWTIDDGKFKSIYDDRKDCLRMNEIGDQSICDDESQVMYRK